MADSQRTQTLYKLSTAQGILMQIERKESEIRELTMKIDDERSTHKQKVEERELARKQALEKAIATRKDNAGKPFRRLFTLSLLAICIYSCVDLFTQLPAYADETDTRIFFYIAHVLVSLIALFSNSVLQIGFK